MKISNRDMANGLNNYFRSAPLDLAFKDHRPAFWTGRDFPVKTLGYRGCDFAVSIPFVMFEGLNLTNLGNTSMNLGKIRSEGRVIDVLEELTKARAILQHYYSGVIFELKSAGMQLSEAKLDVTFYPGHNISSLEISAGLVDIFGCGRNQNGNLYNYTRELKKLGLLG